MSHEVSTRESLALKTSTYSSLEKTKRVVFCALALSLAACNDDESPTPEPGPPSTYTIGGSVSGLSGTGLVLRNNGGDARTVASNGSFTFATSLSTGAAYAVTVGTQPTTPTQTCLVTNASGTVASSNVTNVAVNCTTNTYTISVNVSGLAGTGLVLQNNGGNNLTGANGTAAFTTPVASGAAYAVTVLTQPTNPSQTCTVTAGSGTVATSNVGPIAVACTTNSYAVNVNVSGLAGSGLIVQNNGGNDLAVNANGTTAFTTTIASGGGYDVRVLSQPSTPNQRCTIANSRGAVTNTVVTATVACVTQVPRFAYSLDYGSSSLSIYGVDAATGLLRPRGYAVTGSSPTVSVTDAQQKFWFVLSGTTATLSAFRHNDVTGALTAVAGSPYSTGGVAGATGPVNVSVHPSGNFVYVVNGSGTNNIAAYSINPSSGVLTAIAGQPFAAGSEPIAMAIDATGSFAYVTNRASNNIYTYSIDGSGALTEVANSRVSPGVAPGSLVLHANGRLAFVTNVTDGTIAAFAINPTTGRLSAVTGSPFATGTNPATLPYLHASGKFLYVRNAGAANSAGTVSAYAINQSTGVLTPIGSPVAIGENSVRMTTDPAGKFLFVSNQGLQGANGSLSQFRIDATTGALTALTGVPTWPGRPYYVSVDPSGQYVYVTSAAANTLFAYSLNQTSGALTVLPYGSAFTTRDLPINFNTYSSISTPTAATFSSTTAYVTNGTASGSVGSYQISGNGALSLIDTAAFPSMQEPVGTAVHPNGVQLFVANRSGPTLFNYNITASGALSSVGAGGFTISAPPSFVALDTSGRFAYTANSTNISAFGLSPSSVGTPINNFGAPLGFSMAATGRFLYSLSSSTFGRWFVNTDDGALQAGGGMTVNSVSTYTIDPTTRFAFIASASGISVFPIDPVDGFSPSTESSAVTTGITHRALAVDPTGRYLYAANGTSNTVSAFRINQISGALTAIASPYAAGNNVVALSTDYSGRYLYAVNQGSSSVSMYAIDGTTGALTALGTPIATGSTANSITLSNAMQ